MDEEKINSKLRLLNILKDKKFSIKHEDKRLPPGQRLITDEKHFPILDLGIRPDINLKKWKLEISGPEVGIKDTIYFSLSELKNIVGQKEYKKDFHCVTTWTKYDLFWSGIPLNDLINYLKKYKGLTNEWQYLIQYGFDEYSTNVSRQDIEKDDCFIAFELNNKEIPLEHGKIRIIIPHLYGWKGSKFLKKLKFSKSDEPGFWEVRGYHNRGDAFEAERYS